MTVKELRQQAGLTQGEFAARFLIPLRTLQHWESGDRVPPDYVIELLAFRIAKEQEK